MLTLLKSFVTEEKGQGMAEYGLILALVALVVVVALTALGGGLDRLFTAITGKLPAAPATP